MHDLDTTKAVLLKKDGTLRKSKGGRREGQRTARDHQCQRAEGA